MRRTLGVLTLSLTALPIFRVSAQGVDRTKPPALPAPPALKLPAVQTTTLPNGLMLAVVEMHKVPVVDAQLLQQRDEPVAVANIAFPAIVYGREHPYGHPLNGTDSATARLARERVT